MWPLLALEKQIEIDFIEQIEVNCGEYYWKNEDTNNNLQ